MIYATDLDGTLLNEKAVLSTYTRNVLIDFLKENKMTFLTARSYSVCRQILGDISFNIPCAVLNGSYIINYSSGEILEEHTLDTNCAMEIIQYLITSGIIPIIICTLDGRERMLYGEYYNKGYEEFIEQRKGDERLMFIDFNTFDFYYSSLSFITIQLIDKEMILRDIEKKLKKYNLNIYLDKELYCLGYYYLNINPQNATKARALENIADLIQTDVSDFVVFGDQSNDFEMFQVAGQAYAVRNAVDDLKRIATDIIDENYNDGVAKFLEKIM